MTMIPSQNLFRQQFCGSYCQGFGFVSRSDGYDYCSETCLLGSDLVVDPMAEDESRTGSTVNETAGSSSKDVQQDKDDGWLQLSIGRHTVSNDKKQDQADQRGRLMELDLLPSSNCNSDSQVMRTLGPMLNPTEYPAPQPSTFMNLAAASGYNIPFFWQHPAGTSSSFPRQEINWAFRPNPVNIATSSSSTQPLPFQLHTGMDISGPGLDFRVICPPRRPHSGIWFMLQASQNQAKEPFLPQISKSYLRIKDGSMTIQLVIKYLVNKLKLESESEIEITCKRQKLQPFLTLQHVRDNIWRAMEMVTLLPDSSTTDQIMVLHYGRSA
ncbi:RING finger protein [Forsythia ovata]|uniref:RING finger protein n=1 Tax=Forsythia ovata TaxID=205694 RepID=A0ABD1XGI0_9LAMI